MQLSELPARQRCAGLGVQKDDLKKFLPWNILPTLHNSWVFVHESPHLASFDVRFLAGAPLDRLGASLRFSDSSDGRPLVITGRSFDLSFSFQKNQAFAASAITYRAADPAFRHSLALLLILVGNLCHPIASSNTYLPVPPLFENGHGQGAGKSALLCFFAKNRSRQRAIVSVSNVRSPLTAYPATG